MSKLNKPCNPKVQPDTKLYGYNERYGEVEIELTKVGNLPEIDICNTIGACPVIKGLQAKDIQLQNQIDALEEDRIPAVEAKVTANTQRVAALEQKDRDHDLILGEVGDNVTMLKNWNVRQDHAIKALQVKVVTDRIFNNFEEWVENVYIPQCDAITNKYARGDMYINVNQSIAATNATYVNVRNPNATTPCSANDWQELYYSAPADVLSVMGIDPIEVAHNSKRTWTISLNPEKFQDFMSGLTRLDLSKVDVSLGEVYFDPIFKEDATIQENLNVGNTTTTQNLTVTENTKLNNAVIADAKITNVSAPVHFDEKVTVSDLAEVDMLKVVQRGDFNNANLIGSTRVERFDGDVYASESVRVGENLRVTGTVTVETRADIYDANITHTLQIPTADQVRIGGKDLQTWLIEFGNRHWMPR